MRYVLLVVVLAGCATPEFYKPGQTQQEFDRDTTDCQVLTSEARLGFFYRQSFFEKCMSGRGWTKK